MMLAQIKYNIKTSIRILLGKDRLPQIHDQTYYSLLRLNCLFEQCSYGENAIDNVDCYAFGKAMQSLLKKLLTSNQNYYRAYFYFLKGFFYNTRLLSAFFPLFENLHLLVGRIKK